MKQHEILLLVFEAGQAKRTRPPLWYMFGVFHDKQFFKARYVGDRLQ